MRANRLSELACRMSEEERKGKVKYVCLYVKGKVKYSMHAYMSSSWRAAHSEPIVIIFGMFNGLTNVVNKKKFQDDCLRDFRLVDTLKLHVPTFRKAM